MSRRDRPFVEVLRASTIMLVFPARVVIFLGMIYAIGAGNRLVGLALMAVGVLAYIAIAKVLAVRPRARLDAGRRGRAAHGPGWIRPDRPTQSVSELVFEGKGPPTPLTKDRRKLAEW